MELGRHEISSLLSYESSESDREPSEPTHRASVGAEQFLLAFRRGLTLKLLLWSLHVFQLLAAYVRANARSSSLWLYYTFAEFKLGSTGY